MIRDARPDDAAAIAEIWNAAIRDSTVTFNSAEKSVEEVARIIAARQRDGRCFLVAEGPPGIAGFITHEQFRGGIGYRLTMEHTIQLAPRARGRGIGRALMQDMEGRARIAGVHVMVAAVTSENPSGRAFHEALGYRLVGTMPEVGHKFGRFMNLWLLQKMLT